MDCGFGEDMVDSGRLVGAKLQEESVNGAVKG